MESIKDIFLLLLSALTFYFAFRYRKKDFQIAILREQIIVYNELLNNLFDTSRVLSNLYNAKLGELILKKGTDFSEEERQLQEALVYIDFTEPYNQSYDRFQRIMYLLPREVLDASLNYYSFLSDLMESDDDPEIGLKINTELREKIFDLIDVIRPQMAIDEISENTRGIMREEF